jgi:uncharacterized DUF497 family protein
MIIIEQCTNFQWDEGNSEKNWVKHKITKLECEQIFFNSPLLITNDKNNSQKEERHLALGKTDESKKLFICFTIRDEFIRIVSAREMTLKERKIYGK